MSKKYLIFQFQREISCPLQLTFRVKVTAKNVVVLIFWDRIIYCYSKKFLQLAATWPKILILAVIYAPPPPQFRPSNNLFAYIYVLIKRNLQVEDKANNILEKSDTIINN